MGKKFIISEDERNRILGLHETAKNNHSTMISEQYAGVAFGAEQNGLRIKKVEATEQAVAGQPVAQPTSQPQNTGVPNLSVFDKYIPSNAEMMQYVKSMSGLKTDEEIQKSLQNPFYTKLSKILNTVESNIPIEQKSLPTQDENWREWYVAKGLGTKDNRGNINIDINALNSKAPALFTQAAQKYDWDKVKQALGVVQQFAKQYPNDKMYSPNFNAFYKKAGIDYNTMARANAVGASVGLIGRNKDLTPLRNLS